MAKQELVWNFKSSGLYNRARKQVSRFRDERMADDIEVINRVLNGDVEAFRPIVERYQRPVISMIGNLLGDRHMCEDVAQEVFLSAYKKLSSFDPARSRFSTWLFTIARNKSINAMKKKRPEPTACLPESGSQKTAAERSELAELFGKVDETLKTIGDKYRRALVMAEFEGLPYEQIAQIEGIRVGTVKSRINRAKRKLREAISGLEGDIS